MHEDGEVFRRAAIEGVGDDAPDDAYFAPSRSVDGHARMLGRNGHSNYGPTADTGGLMQNHAPTIYAYESLEALLAGEATGGPKAKLPGMGGKAVTERPG